MSPDDSTRFNILEFCIRRHGWRRGATEDASKCNARQGFDMSNFLLRKDSQRIFPYVKPTRPDRTNQDSSTGMSHIELEQWLGLEGEIIPYYIEALGRRRLRRSSSFLCSSEYALAQIKRRSLLSGVSPS